MQKILIVSNVNSYLLMSLKACFKHMLYQIVEASGNIDQLNDISGSLNAMMIFTDEKLIHQDQVLVYLKDLAITHDIPIFTIGNAAETTILNALIPDKLIAYKFMRPLSIPVHVLTESIDNIIKQYYLQKKKKILVVDDSGAMLRNIKGWLEDKYHVILANSGAMTIKYLTLNRPDLVLLDYEMPVVDGKQILEMMRTEADFSDIPVIFLTNKGDIESVKNVQKLKPEGYLLKTMEPSKIVQIIDDLFEKRRIQQNS